jgi:hypothetical protein
MGPNFDVKYKIPRFLIGSDGLLTETMRCEGGPLFDTWWDLKVQV